MRGFGAKIASLSGAVSSADRALASHARGHWFKSSTAHHEVVNNQGKLFTKELLESFLSSRPQGISHNTVTLYRFALSRFIGYPLTPEGINSYLNSLSCQNGKHNYYRVIKTLCHWLHRGGYLSVNPVEYVSAPRRQKKLLPAITKEQLEVLLDHCHCERDRALISGLHPYDWTDKVRTVWRGRPSSINQSKFG